MRFAMGQFTQDAQYFLGVLQDVKPSTRGGSSSKTVKLDQNALLEKRLDEVAVYEPAVGIDPSNRFGCAAYDIWAKFVDRNEGGRVDRGCLEVRDEALTRGLRWLAGQIEVLRSEIKKQLGRRAFSVDKLCAIDAHRRVLHRVGAEILDKLGRADEIEAMLGSGRLYPSPELQQIHEQASEFSRVFESYANGVEKMAEKQSSAAKRGAMKTLATRLSETSVGWGEFRRDFPSFLWPDGELLDASDKLLTVIAKDTEELGASSGESKPLVTAALSQQKALIETLQSTIREAVKLSCESMSKVA